MNAIAKSIARLWRACATTTDYVRVEGVPNPADQRSSLIELTQAGERILAQATEVFEVELERQLSAVLSARSLAQFRASLMKLRAVGQRLNRTERK